MPSCRYKDKARSYNPRPDRILAITAFLESGDFEDALRKAVSPGGDSDTLACITGGIAHAFYGPLPEHITRRVYSILEDRLGEVTREFMNAFAEANSD